VVLGRVVSGRRWEVYTELRVRGSHTSRVAVGPKLGSRIIQKKTDAGGGHRFGGYCQSFTLHLGRALLLQSEVHDAVGGLG
jgi:hypothetical protein